MNKNVTNRNYKSRIFEMIFSDKKELLGLYNAINGTNYQNPEALQINTLENAIYLSMHNDISFVIDLRLNLYEHQSTWNPNLPLRFLMYIADLYAEITRESNLYGSKMIRIPTPKFIIFYNGTEEQPERQVLQLSDAFTIQGEEICLELKAMMLNINFGYNEEIMNACKTLKDYSVYTELVRRYAQTMPLDDAVEQAITECIKGGILFEFLSRNRMEAKKMSIYEYDEEKCKRWFREEGYEEGIEEGRKEGRKEGERFVQLTKILLEKEETEELLKATTNVEYRNYLFEIYKI